MFSNRYIFVYSTVLVVVAAAVLAIAAVGLKPFQDQNEKVEKMQQLLSSVGIYSTVDSAEDLYEKYFTEEYAVNTEGKVVSSYVDGKQNGDVRPFSIDMNKEMDKIKNNSGDVALPVFVCTKEDGRKNYVVPVVGNGLWGGIWGNIAVDEDLNTIVGVNFGHKSETPGLGGEIVTDKFQSQFKGKSIFGKDGGNVELAVIKRADKTDAYQVDAISGATITSTGVSDMLKNCLGLYIEFFRTLKTK